MKHMKKKRRAADIITEEASRHADNLVRFGKLESGQTTLTGQIEALDKKIQDSILNPTLTQQLADLSLLIKDHMQSDNIFQAKTSDAITGFTDVVNIVKQELLPAYQAERGRDSAKTYLLEKVKSASVWAVSLMSIGGFIWAIFKYIITPIFVR